VRPCRHCGRSDVAPAYPRQAPLPLLPTGADGYVTAPLDLTVAFADDALELDGKRAPRLATPSSAS
jgi:hypothetical protein